MLRNLPAMKSLIRLATQRILCDGFLVGILQEMSKQTHLRDVCQLLDNEVKGFLSVAHSSKHKHLLSDQPFPLAQLMSGFQAIALAADQESHESLRIIFCIQLYLQPKIECSFLTTFKIQHQHSVYSHINDLQLFRTCCILNRQVLEK